MDSKVDIRLSFIIIVVSVFVAFLTLFTVSNVNTGLNFGHDVRIVVTTQDDEALTNFLVSQTRNDREWRRRVIDSDSYVLSFSGVENVDDLVASMRHDITDLNVIKVGTFGSVPNLLSNQSFVSLYLLLFMVLTGLYFTYRFRFFGWVATIEVVSAEMGALLLVSFLGYPFTKTLWYTLLICFMLMVYQKQTMLIQSKGQSLNGLKETNSLLYQQHGKVSLAQAVFYIVFGAIAIIYNKFGMIRSGWFMMILGYISIIQYAVIRFIVFPKIMKYEDKSVLLSFQDQARIVIKGPIETFFKNFLIIILVLSLGATMVAIPRGFKFTAGRDFANHNVIIVEDSSSVTYLEVQALLYRDALYNHQFDYDVTEQKDLWIYFDDTVANHDLERLALEISQEYGHDALYYSTHGRLFPLLDWNFYEMTLLFNLALWFVVALFFGFKDTYFIPILSVLSSALFIIYTNVFGMFWTRETMLVIWMMPLAVSIYFTSLYSMEELVTLEDYQATVVRIVRQNLILYLLLALPIVVIIPIPITVEMLSYLLIMLLALYLALYMIYFLMKRARKWWLHAIQK